MNGQLAFPLTLQDNVTNLLTLGDAGGLARYLGIPDALAQSAIDGWSESEDGFQDIISAVGVDAETIRDARAKCARFQTETVRTLLYHATKH